MKKNRAACKTPTDDTEVVPPVSAPADYRWIGGSGSVPTVFCKGFCKKLNRLRFTLAGCLAAGNLASLVLPATLRADLPHGYLYVSAGGADSPAYGVGHTSIQEAINTATNGSTVWVEDGFVCDTGGTYMSGTAAQTNRIVLNKAITLRSVSGTTHNPVMIVGAHHDPAGGIINGTAAIRPLYVSASATIIGLMLTNGATTATTTSYGGGAFVVAAGSGTVFSNCVIVANNAFSHGGGVFALTDTEFWHCAIVGNTIPSQRGGGVYRGILRHCLIKDNNSGPGSNGAGGGLWGSTASHCHIVGNISRNGGGVHGSTVSYSTIVSNTAPYGGGANESTITHSRLDFNTTRTSPTSDGSDGGAARLSTLIDCVLTGNWASYLGSAMRSGKAVRCVITNNVNGRIGAGVIYQAEVINSVIQDNKYTGGLGGIVRYGTVVNSLFIGNEARDIWNGNLAAVVREATIYNSTIADNDQGRAAFGSTLINTIAWNNWQPGTNNIATNSLIAASAVISGQDNLDTDPLFVGSGDWPYRLRGASLCIDHGIGGFDWMLPSHPDTLGLDLSGRRRVIGKAVDLGAFEFMPEGTALIFR